MTRKLRPPALPVQGRTFSLFGVSSTTIAYFRAVSALADRYLEKEPDIHALVELVRNLGRRSRWLSSPGNAFNRSLVHDARDVLAPYTTAVPAHLRELPFYRSFSTVISFTEQQYHLAMLEIELMNRLNAPALRQAKRKIAFLPHCLRDLDANCRAGIQEIDHVCRGCSERCHVNAVSTLLRQNRIEPYIWMRANLKKLFRRLRDEEGGLGVMGIACIPELVRGMRMGDRLGVPVVGVPLNANRCARWMGAFHPTSVELEEVKRLSRPPES